MLLAINLLRLTNDVHLFLLVEENALAADAFDVDFEHLRLPVPALLELNIQAELYLLWFILEELVVHTAIDGASSHVDVPKVVNASAEYTIDLL